jgi:hypothetical protein
LREVAKSKIQRLTKRAVNIDEKMPTIRVTAKPRIGPVPNWNRKRAAIRVVTLASRIEERAFSNPVAMAELHRAALAELLADALEDQHVGVHRHADGQDDAGDAGQGQRGPEVGQCAEHQHHVERQGDHRVDAGPLVDDEHREDDQERRRSGRPGRPCSIESWPSDGPTVRSSRYSMPAGRAPERSVVTRSWTCCWVKLPLDDPLVGDPAVDPRRRHHLAVEDDGEPAADVLAGGLAEAVGAVGREGEVDYRLLNSPRSERAFFRSRPVMTVVFWTA